MLPEEWFGHCGVLFNKKNRQYGRQNVDPESVVARIRDKLARLEHRVEAGADSTEDACRDLANYAYILSELLRGSWSDGIDRTKAWVVGELDTPKKQGDVGFDLHSMVSAKVCPGSFVKIHTGVRVLSPRGCWYSIRGRSSLAWRGLVVVDNVIDEGYTGELVVLVHNVGEEVIDIGEGDRIAQLVFFQSVVPAVQAVEVLPVTERGDNGWGSTGR